MHSYRTGNSRKNSSSNNNSFYKGSSNRQQVLPHATISGECYDYRFGFCINGVKCTYKHVRRAPEEMEQMPRIPDWYFEKIRSVFAQENVTDYH